MWDLCAGDVDEASPEIRMESEEMLMVEEVGNGGLIICVCSFFHERQDPVFNPFP